MRNLVLLVLLTAVAPWASAQRPAGTHFAPPRAPAPDNLIRRSGAGSFPGLNRDGRSFLYPVGLFSDPFYSDALSRTGYPVASQPPVIIMQAPASSSVPEQASQPAAPLMIELQGDRYVRISGAENSAAETIDRDSNSTLRTGSPAAIRSVATQELHALLVFRDGHCEEVSDYTIAAGILYARGDDYSSGSWNKKIELSSLNLPETVNSNRSRGVPFQLPKAPNEVMVGP